jgi:hypothetical protein
MTYVRLDDLCEACYVTDINYIASSPVGCSCNDVCAIVYNDDVSHIVNDVSAIDFNSSAVIGHDVCSIVDNNDVTKLKLAWCILPI